MGKIKQGILGGFSGKVAGVVGSSWKGINVMRAMPISVANPRTTPQVNQRNKFSQSILFASQILSTIIKPLWDRFAVQMSGYNAFIADNINNFNAEGLITPENLIFSKGKMAAVPGFMVQYDSTSHHFTLFWLDDLEDNYMSEDDVMSFGVFVTEVKDKVDAKSSVAVRSSLTYDYAPFKSPNSTETWHFWISFKRPDGTIVSNSSYTNIVIP
jgi:hypothetical protein